MEYHTLPHLRAAALPMFRELVAASGATSMEAQTNMPLMLLMFLDCVSDIHVENVLFADAGPTHLPCPKGVFRHSIADDFPADDGPDWVVEADGEIVANGGFLCHYNPPYGDVYMEVAEPHRRQGLGSYIVQEVKRVCYEAGKRPAARCNADNVASRRTLQRAGLLPCGRLLSGGFSAP
ncbi:MAG: GNAT family N-acetyltransferase [Armatimonadetes bacterium]|nr:GNAT family N-acetyltransferase [Armatimonadota bacterium]